VSYAEDVRRLAGAAAMLVGAGPPAPDSVHPNEQQTGLAARDAVAGELRSLTTVLLGERPTRAERPELLASSPAHALRAALNDLPATATAPLPQTGALARNGGPFTRGWQDAARAAVALERYHDLLACLPGPQAWAAIRDVAELAAALPQLDADLAAALPTAGTEGARAALLDPVPHGLLRLAADELRVHTADLPAGSTDLALPERPRLQPPSTLADLPGATRQLALLVAHRGPHLTAAESRAALRVLADGVDLTGRVLALTHPAKNHPTAIARQHLQDALPDLQQLLHEPLATLTRPAPAVLYLAEQIRARLGTAAALADRLQDQLQPADTREADFARLAAPLTRWAIETPALIAALEDSLSRAIDTRRLLAPRQEPTRGRRMDLLWLPVANAAGDHPAISAASRSTAHLSTAARHLAAVTGTDTGTEIGTDTAAGRTRSAARTAAIQAGLAFDSLTAVLRARQAAPWPNPARAAHPALPPDPQQRRSRNQR